MVFRMVAGMLLVTSIAFGMWQSPARRGDGDWPSFCRDPGARRYSPLTQINTSRWSRRSHDHVLTPFPTHEGHRHRMRAGFEHRLPQRERRRDSRVTAWVEDRGVRVAEVSVSAAAEITGRAFNTGHGVTGRW
jgi:hypothetical protein